MLLGVDGISDFNGLHSRRHDDEIEFYAKISREEVRIEWKPGLLLDRRGAVVKEVL